MYHIYSKFGISRFPFSADMASSGPRNIYKSPHNVRIANFQNTGGPWIPCPYPGCILSFTTPNGLQNTFEPVNTGSIRTLNHLHPQCMDPSDTNHDLWSKHQVKHHAFRRRHVSRSLHCYIVIRRPQIKSQSHTTNCYLPF